MSCQVFPYNADEPKDIRAIANKGVHVWLMRPQDEPSETNWDVLSEQERERANRFVYDRDRSNWVQAKAFWREVIAKHLNCSAKDVVVASQQYGSYITHPHIFQSLTHTKGLVVVAVSKKCNVGIDAEYIKIVDYTSVASMTFSDKEIELFLRGEDKNKDFYRLWTKKEAWSKALGRGLYAPFSSLEVRLEKEYKIYDHSSTTLGAKEWQFLEIDVGAAHITSLVYSGPKAPVYCWSFDNRG